MTQVNNSSPLVSAVLGGEVATEVLQWIGAFRLLTKATIISFNMQDYDFWGNGRLSDLLIRQLAYGAQITVMTTPPPGSSGKRAAFRRKLDLLEELDKNGADVYVHPHLHAKAYLFCDDADAQMVIIGSPNLTYRGFGTKGSETPDLLELAFLTGDPSVYSSTTRVIGTELLGNPATLHFPIWVAKNRAAIADAKGPT